MKLEPTVLVAIGLVITGATVLAALKVAQPEVFTQVALVVLAWLAPSPAKKELS